MRIVTYQRKNVEYMGGLLANGMVPLSFRHFMLHDLENLINAIEEDRELPWSRLSPELSHYYKDTGTPALYDRDKLMIPLARNARRFWELLKVSAPLTCDGAVFLPNGFYEQMRGTGYEFRRSELERYINRPLAESEVPDNLLWLALAEDDKPLVREYTRATFYLLRRAGRFLGKGCHIEEKAMGIYIDEPKQEAIGRLWFASDKGGIADASNRFARLYDCYGRLFGASPEALAELEQRRNAILQGVEGKIPSPTQPVFAVSPLLRRPQNSLDG